MSARNLRQMIARLRDEGVTVFLTTHYLEEAERLCDRVAVVVKGRIVALDTVAGLRSGAQKKTVVEMTLVDSEGHQETKRVECDDGVESAIQRLLSETGGRHILSIDTLRPSLEDVFIQLTGLSAEAMLSEKGGKGGGNASG
jgi:ABC-2 type transport system ATP-binding protein